MISSLQNRLLGGVAIIIASVLWGTTGVSATFAPQVNVLAIGSAAMGIGGILQALLAIGSIYQSWRYISRQWRWVLAGALNIMVYPLAFYSSMDYAGVTVGTVVSIGSAPIFSAIIERLFDKNCITVQWIIGTILGCIGIILLCMVDNRSQFADVNFSECEIILGAFYGLIAGLTYAFYSWIARYLMQREIPTKAAMGMIFGLGGMMLIPVLFFTGKAFLNSWGNIAVGIYMGFVPMFIGYLCFGYGLARIQSSIATMITLLEPVVAALLASFIVGEKISVLGWEGISLIFLCLVCVTFPIRLFKK